MVLHNTTSRLVCVRDFISIRPPGVASSLAGARRGYVPFPTSFTATLLGQTPDSQPRHLSSNGVSARHLSICFPHPAHVNLPHALQVSFQHIIDASSTNGAAYVKRLLETVGLR